MSRILLVEDDPDTQNLVNVIIGASHRVVCCGTVKAAREQLARGAFDLILLDVTLPDGDGFRFCSEIKSETSTAHIPVLFLTGRSDISDKELGFSLGADDYLIKPFEPRELRARVEARLRRAKLAEGKEEILRRGNITFHLSLQKVFITVGGIEEALELTPLEYRLLLFFARHEDQVHSRDHLITTIWSDGLNVLDRTVDAHISNLRKKIATSQFTIKSVYGVGYSFCRAKGPEPVKDASPAAS